MIRLNCNYSSILWLSLEPFYNAGLSPERAKEIIENIPDPVSRYSNLKCEPQGINNNWNVRVLTIAQGSLLDIKNEIQYRLNMELEQTKK